MCSITCQKSAHIQNEKHMGSGPVEPAYSFFMLVWLCTSQILFPECVQVGLLKNKDVEIASVFERLLTPQPPLMLPPTSLCLSLSLCLCLSPPCLCLSPPPPTPLCLCMSLSLSLSLSVSVSVSLLLHFCWSHLLTNDWRSQRLSYDCCAHVAFPSLSFTM